MNTEQIIKALECCTSESTEFDCTTCPYMYKGCNINVMRDALALIKNQLGEIRGLNSAIETLQGVAKDYENHNENLKRENKYLREHMWDEVEHAKDLVITDTVKKMQEKLKKRLYDNPCLFTQQRYIVDADIDQIAKEMMEGRE